MGVEIQRRQRRAVSALCGVGEHQVGAETDQAADRIGLAFEHGLA